MRFLRGLATALLLTAFPMAATAQTDAGQISGTIRDSSNSFVAGARVTARNEKTGETRSVESNAAGFFVIAQLKPSTYTLSAEKSGFSNIEYQQMPVALGQSWRSTSNSGRQACRSQSRSLPRRQSSMSARRASVRM